jgi:hypothetical protein
MNITSRDLRSLVLVTASLSLGSMGLAACGSSGPPSASSLIATAKPLVANPAGRSCTTHVETPSSAGEEQVASCGSLRAWVLTSGMTFTSWATSTGAYCGPDYVSGPGWVLAVSDTTVAATNRIASAMDGAIEAPAACAGVPTNTYSPPSSTKPTSGSQSTALALYGGTGQEVDLAFPASYSQQANLTFNPDDIVLVPGAQAAFQTTDAAKGTAPRGKQWLQVVVSDGQGLCDRYNGTCSGGVSYGTDVLGPVSAVVNGTSYPLTQGGDGGAVQMNSLAPCNNNSIGLEDTCTPDVAEVSNFYALVPKAAAESLSLDIGGTISFFDSGVPNSNITFPAWSEVVPMTLGALYSPPGLG